VENKVLTWALVALVVLLSVALATIRVSMATTTAALASTRKSLEWYQSFTEKQAHQLYAQGRLLSKLSAAPDKESPGASQESGPEPKPSTVTAYTHTGNRTASGRWPIVGRSCAGPRSLPLGTVVWIDGVGLRIVEDRTHKRYDGRFDVFMETEAECLQFGKQKLTVEVIK